MLSRSEKSPYHHAILGTVSLMTLDRVSACAVRMPPQMQKKNSRLPSKSLGMLGGPLIVTPNVLERPEGCLGSSGDLVPRRTWSSHCRRVKCG